MRSRRARVVRGMGLALLVIVVIFSLGAGALIWSWSRTATDYPAAHFNSGLNAVWLEHAWSGSPHTNAEYDRLAAELKARQITFVYAHVGPLDSNGTIPDDRAPYAQRFAAAMHERMPDLRVLAWIGQNEAASGNAPEDVVQLDDSSVRTHIALTAARFVKVYGFNGRSLRYRANRQQRRALPRSAGRDTPGAARRRDISVAGQNGRPTPPSPTGFIGRGAPTPGGPRITIRASQRSWTRSL